MCFALLIWGNREVLVDLPKCFGVEADWVV